MLSSHPIDVHVGKQLRLRRTALGMTQAALGEALGVTFQQVQKYERGVNRMGAGRLYDAATVLGAPVACFYPAEGAAIEADASRENLEAMKLYERVGGADVRRRLRELMKAMGEAA